MPISAANAVDPRWENLAVGLCHVLGNTCRLARTSMSYSWNVTGPGARSFALVLEQHGAEMHDQLKPLALLIRGLSSPAYLNYHDTNLAVDPPRDGPMPGIEGMMAALVEGHRQASLSVDATLDLARDCEDAPSIAHLSAHLGLHRRMVWELSAEQSAI
ncbi:MAG: ferritin-like domain-containing protein [Pseudomonadota bacterium]